MSDLTPVPGDVPTIERTARSYTEVAEAVHNAAEELRDLASKNSSAESQAITALAQNAGDTADRMSQLESRYRTTGSALDTYATELDAIKQDADGAITRHQEATEDYNKAERWVNHYRTRRANAVDEDAADEAYSSQLWWEQQRDSAYDRLVRAANDLEDAHAAQDQAARTAADAIDAAVDNDGLNDSWWDNVKGWVAENAEFLKTLKDVLAWVTTGLTFLSFVFPVLAPIALVTGALMVGLSALLAATGEISWLEFGLDALVLLTAGVGAVGSRIVSQSVKGLKGLRVARLRALGGSKSPLRQVTGSFNRLGLPTNTIKQKFVQMLTNGRKFRGVGNAHAQRIFTQAKAGAGPLDDFFIKNGLDAILAMRATATGTAVIKGADTALGYSHPIADFFESINFAPVAGPARFLGETHDNVHEWTTFSVGGSR